MSTVAFRPRKVKKEVNLNVTSLIDVLFLLLIFFMLTGTFKRVGELELQLPDSSSSSPADGTLSHQVEVVITEEGVILINGESVPFPDVKRRLEALHADDAQNRVMIKAETGVPHGDVVRVLDLVREAGFPGVGIGTQMGNVGSGGP